MRYLLSKNLPPVLLGAITLLYAANLLAGVPQSTLAEAEDQDEITRRWRLGPLLEYRATARGGSFWALRPLYSKLREPVADTTLTDVLWPLNTFHRDQERFWWRVILAYGFNDDLGDRERAWSTAILPLWFRGRTRQGESYWGLFPIYGHLPHILMMDNIDFALFPLYLDFEINGIERRYTPWPLYSHLKPNPHIEESGLFPFWSSQINHKYAIQRRYALWPIWNSARYDDERNPGTSALLFPLYGRIERVRERQRLFLPPFFSYAETDSARRWRMPWPFYETLETFETKTTAAAFKRSYWPLYGSEISGADRRSYALWPFYWRSTLNSPNRRGERRRFFPFYTDERLYKRAADGTEYESERYTRIWPFYLRERKGDQLNIRALEFNLIRHSGAIERNWSPFWTLYEYRRTPKGTSHDLLWGLISWEIRDRKEGERHAR